GSAPPDLRQGGNRPQPQSTQVRFMRTLLVSADLIGGEVSRNKQSRHHGELRRLRLRIAQALAPG
ncbi:MAG: hypothetical protein IJI53_01775, partial [Clostridia bacterium]|nr:hypothetical protein [Clostridia bacterium]